MVGRTITSGRLAGDAILGSVFFGFILTGRAGLPHGLMSADDSDVDWRLDGDVCPDDWRRLLSERREFSISLRILRSRSKSRPISDSKRRLLDTESLYA